MKFLNIIPISEEACELAKVLEFQRDAQHFIIDDDLARTLPYCDGLEAALFTGIPDLTDRTLIILANTANRLRILDVSGCREITDVGVRDLAVHATQLEAVRLNSVVGIKDPSVSALVRSLPHLAELELTDLPLLTAASVRDIWTFAKKLRILRLARCPQLTDKGFPHPFPPSPARALNKALHTDHTLKHKKPINLQIAPHSNASGWLDSIPPLLLPDAHVLENLRLLDLAYCKNLTDNAIAGAVAHAPKIHHISFAGCPLLTDATVRSLCQLSTHLEYVSLAHVEQMTDSSLVDLVRSCPNVNTIDISCECNPARTDPYTYDNDLVCHRLTDLTVLELATLRGLRRLSMSGVPHVTQNGLSFLAEHALQLVHLHISYCTHDTIDLHVIHLLLRKLVHLVNFSGSGIRALTRKGIKRFSEPGPPVCPHRTSSYQLLLTG